MKTRATEAWQGATLSVYSSNADGQGYLQLDNVAMFYRANETIDTTLCTDPGTPNPPDGAEGADLINNGGFTAPIGSNANNAWATFGNISAQVVSGVAELYRTTGTPAGSLPQNDPTTMAAGMPLEAMMQLGNSSSVRQRITVLIHAANFNDLQVCVFWLPPNSPLQSYTLRAYATIGWSAGTSISFYPSPAFASPPNGRIRVDNVTLRARPALDVIGTECYEPGSAAIAGETTASDSLAPTLEATATAGVATSLRLNAEQPLVATATPLLAEPADKGEGVAGGEG